MRIVRGLESVDLKLDKSVLSIGNFDGFHRGHQQLLTQGALLAANERVPLVVLTFEPHPMTILKPQSMPQRLSTLKQKLHLLARSGVDITVVAESTRELLGMEAECFIETVAKRFHPTHIVEGSSFAFGRQRRGTPDMLRSHGRRIGFSVCIIEPVRLPIESAEGATDEFVVVSSSVIRRLVLEGKVHRAALCLGRRYTLAGTVVPGDGRGLKMGFPTANIAGIEQLIPADGVYAGVALVRGEKILAGISIGTNPTFDGSARKVEVHLLDFDENVTDESIDVEFGIWLRCQQKFDSAEQLACRIAADVTAVKAWGQETKD